MIRHPPRPFIDSIPSSPSPYVSGTSRRKNSALPALTRSQAKKWTSFVQVWPPTGQHGPVSGRPSCVPRTSSSRRRSSPLRCSGGSLLPAVKVEMVRNFYISSVIYMQVLSYKQLHLRVIRSQHHCVDATAHRGKSQRRFYFLCFPLKLRSVQISHGALSAPPPVLHLLINPMSIRVRTESRGRGTWSHQPNAVSDFSPH
jgi:hypothetical protein